MVSFWGPLNANIEPLYEDQVENPVIVILASIRLSTYKGSHIILANLFVFLIVILT